MAVVIQPKPPKEYNYGDVIISLENCILPEDKLSETPSMKDGLDRETETNLRMFACELIQTSGILLKLPQVAMATGQVLLQRFYYSKSFVKHDFEIYAMACIFLAAKIEEAPRRLRDVVNVFHHIKQKRSGSYLDCHQLVSERKRPTAPMDCLSNTYASLKSQVIKAERRVLKELGFCVHVKHPHKIIITYLQILDCEKNVELAQKSWNYMNDCLRSDVFVKFAPEKIACACIFLAARIQQVPLPFNPPWWELFGSRIEEVEEIAVTMLGIYARPRISRSKLELAVEKAKKLVQDKKDATKDGTSTTGSFTPAHISPATATISSSNSKPGSPTKVSPADSTSALGMKGRTEKLLISNSRSESKHSESKHSETKRRIERDRNALGIRPTRDNRRPYRERRKSPTPPKRRKAHSESDTSSESESDSGSSSGVDEGKPTQSGSSNEESSSSASSEEDEKVKQRKAESNQNKRIARLEGSKERPRIRKDLGSENGHKAQYDYNKRIRSRSPYRRSRSRSRSRSRERQLKRDKKLKMKKRAERFQTKVKSERDRYFSNHSADRYDKLSKKIKR